MPPKLDRHTYLTCIKSNGSRFRCEIAPRMAKFMRTHDPCAESALTIAQLEHMARLPPRRGQARDLRELEALAFSFTIR